MISLDQNSRDPLYVQIYDSIRRDITENALKPGEKLMPIRKLAESLDVSRNTVENAYAQLLTEGYVTSRSGSGYVVRNVDFSPLSEASVEKDRAAASRKTKQVTSSAAIGRVSPSLTEEGLSGRNAAEHAAARSTKLTSLSPSENRAPHAPAIEFDFTYGDRPRGSFPEVAWRKLTGDALFSVDSKANAYGDGLGEMELRAEIARRIHATRGVNCDPEQVVLQAGTQAALGNLLDLFDPMRDGVAIENPGYDGAMAVFRNRGFRITPLPVCPDTTEAQQDAFASSLYASGAKLTFCTPSNQFPLGMTMPLSMRVRLIKWAAERDGYILEDDYCREFRYTERPIPSLQSLDTRNRVIYMGTFSKVLSPALRMSYLVLPPQLLDRWREKFARHYCPVPWLSQKVLYLFMSEGYWDRYTRATMTAYHKRRNLLMECLQHEMGGKIEIFGGTAGLHLLVATHDGRCECELLTAAETAGVRVYPTSGYWMPRHQTDPCGRCVLVGFSSIEPELIPEGVHRLAQAWFPEK